MRKPIEYTTVNPAYKCGEATWQALRVIVTVCVIIHLLCN